MARPARAPAAALPAELVEEILLRVPPDDPSRLLHAALFCKLWCRLISARGFRRRFVEFHHRRPPMLGVLCNVGAPPSFVPTSFRPLRRNCRTIDARHGRVVLHSVPWDSGKNPLDNAFVVWDPITGERRELPLLPGSLRPQSWNADQHWMFAGACAHLDCRRGPFLAVFVGTDQHWMFACVYSSETGAWSEQASSAPW